MSSHSPHPHFDDQASLDWITGWDAALKKSKLEQKLVFIEMGRELCSQCRTLVESVVPHPSIAPLLQQSFVALAADCDDPEAAVIELAEQHLSDATMLPFVMFTDGQGRYLDGLAGAVDPVDFLARLERLIAEHKPAPSA